MSLTESQRRRNQVAILTRHHPDSPELIDARRELAATKLAAYIQRTIDAAPPLTAEQRARLSGLLAGRSGGHLA